MIALLDGDIVVHRAAFALEQRHYSIEGEKIVFAKHTDAVDYCVRCKIDIGAIELYRDVPYDISKLGFTLSSIIDKVLRGTGAMRFVLYFSGNNVFRHNIGRTPDGESTYKANREKHQKPLLIEEALAFTHKHFPTQSHPELEADDLLGIYQQKGTVICSIDKDLLQIPGTHYHISKHEFTYVTPNDGEFFLWQQVLSGDPVDGIKGIPGVGPKRAKKILESATHGAPGMVVIDEYLARGLTVEDFKHTYHKIKILTRPLDSTHPYLDMPKVIEDLKL